MTGESCFDSIRGPNTILGRSVPGQCICPCMFGLDVCLLACAIHFFFFFF